MIACMLQPRASESVRVVCAANLVLGVPDVRDMCCDSRNSTTIFRAQPIRHTSFRSHMSRANRVPGWSSQSRNKKSTVLRRRSPNEQQPITVTPSSRFSTVTSWRQNTAIPRSRASACWAGTAHSSRIIWSALPDISPHDRISARRTRVCRNAGRRTPKPYTKLIPEWPRTKSG
ncbi:hypothetical protein BD413DRAFT_87737 [Trametes elegans]|nr:hypothetical protein BD413DRAFT_87737 [Trametes elegans]